MHTASGLASVLGELAVVVLVVLLLLARVCKGYTSTLRHTTKSVCSLAVQELGSLA